MIHQHTYFTIITELELFTIICSQIHKTCPYRRISRIIELFHYIFSNTGRNCITRIPDFALYLYVADLICSKLSNTFFKYSLLSSWPFTTYTGNNKRKNKTAFVLIRFLLLLIRKIFLLTQRKKKSLYLCKIFI